ncbi:type I DNA topoisomerase [Pseudactinotalea sp. HY158]|uniref:type I DNA topoisomerase n=1 Tax=unclassified Pseudactinotalea TaxID=2649176 RepID=UPI001E3C0D4E|nr:type I DNA topoisomerase [Pseudactinotalea sp. HY158]
MSSRKLVIVESPAKARTIAGYLGEQFDVEASVGHIRDLPQPSELPAEMKKGPYKKFAIDVEDGFTPYYVVDPDKKKKVSELRKLLKGADELYLATDEDREGEAIAWHLLQVLEPTIPVKRMVFHEITREAIERALENTRELDDRLVDAQETRRILDRLYGYEVSPVLWRKVRQGLSAGRVQSVATRLVVARERERMAFVAAGYWDLTGTFAAADQAFKAKLAAVDGTRIATGRDFSDAGELKSAGVIALDRAGAESLAAGLAEASFAVRSVETKPYTRRPAAPFTTSTLQQEASRKLRMSANQTMRTAQTLYENGFITYMRTDSASLSGQAVAAARAQATELYGADFIPAKPRTYGKAAKGAQEAHEAIRPAGDTFRTPGQVARELSGEAFRLYELIWKRTVASQMADAKGSTATIRLGAAAADGRDAEFSAAGTVITFRGFLAAYEEGRDADRYDAGANESRLPQVATGDALEAGEIAADGHETTPPPRYTEASLVKALEERGIGRPSTYAATISVITSRGYVDRRGQALIPSWLAFAVVRLLEENYGDLVDYDFTAQMENDLDSIARGEADRVEWLTGFYYGGPGHPGLKPLVESTGDIDARAVNTIDLGQGVALRVGRYGPYVEVAGAEGEDPKRASVPTDIAPDELTAAKALELIETQADGDRELGADPETGHQIVARTGRFGPYVTEVLPETDAKKKPKPRTASLFKDMEVAAIDLETALRLLSLPRTVGTVTEGEGEEAAEVAITAQNGRYGPYLKKGTDSRSLESEQQLFDITLEQALAIFAQPKQRRGAAAAKALAEFGPDPVSGKPVLVKDGRFGPYVTDGTTNATLRKADPFETLTAERAFELIAEKRAAGPAKKPAKKPAAKKPAAKKPAAKKPAAKKK